MTDDKAFCIRCGFRIWRHMDERKVVDQYFRNEHRMCENSLAFRPPLTDNGKGGIMPDWSYREKEPDESNAKVP